MGPGESYIRDRQPRVSQNSFTSSRPPFSAISSDVLISIEVTMSWNGCRMSYHRGKKYREFRQGSLMVMLTMNVGLHRHKHVNSTIP